MTDIIAGIDLGTTNSLIGGVAQGQARLCVDDKGDVLLPSCVGLNAQGKLLVGRGARNRRLVDPHQTILSIKRRMGEESAVQLGEQRLSPPQVSALIVSALLARFETLHGQKPEAAVITVPAQFSDAQRQATRDAGELAGVRVQRLVNEPTAAAVNYEAGGEDTVAVYDLGGGTFDVSILERDEGFLEVRTSRGDTHLGGDDIDRALLEYVLGKLESVARAAVRGGPHAMTRLSEVVERAKITLSDTTEAALYEPYLTGEAADSVHLELVLTRAELEAVTKPFIVRTLRCLDDAIAAARMTARDLDRVVLVGGASKMPLVAQLLSEHLRRPVQVDKDCDRAVALGATRLAARTAGLELDEVLVDITPHSLVLGALDHPAAFDADEAQLAAVGVITRDSVVPAEHTRTVYTQVDDQEEVRAPIAQGEAPRIGGCTRLGMLAISNLPHVPAPSPIEVTFKLDLSGVLHVSGVHLASGTAATVEIADSPHRLSVQQRRRASEQLACLQDASDVAGPKTSLDLASEEQLSLARAMVQRARKVLERREFEQTQTEADAPAAAATNELVDAIEHKSASVEELTEALSDRLLDLL